MGTEILPVLFDSLLDASKILISDPTGDSNLELRDAIGRFLHAFPILNRECHDLASEDASFPAVVYYERVRLNLLFIPTRPTSPGQISFFWEGLPKQLSLALPSTGHIMHQNKFRDLTSCDILFERAKFMQKIEACATRAELDAIGPHGEDHLDHLDSGTIPTKVGVFVLIMRSMFNGIRSAKSPQCFRQCLNKKCNRVFYAESKYRIRDFFDPGSISTRAEVLDVPSCIPNENTYTEHLYWCGCGNIPWYEDTSTRFCTSACCIEWRRKLSSLLPQKIRFDSDGSLPVGKTSRIVLAFEKALERNCAFKSKLESACQGTRRGSVSKKILRNEIESRIDMLNVDTAMLYWATIVSRLPAGPMSTDESLPGLYPDWRSIAMNVKRVECISTIYHEIRGQGGPTLITDMLTTNRLFSTVKSRCMELR